MSFHPNNAQQMALDDPLLSLTERERKYLNNSWAETFSKKVFPFIKEDRLSVLYSNNSASRPNNPVNVYFGLLVLKEVFNQSDEEALNSLMFDIRYQYAKHIGYTANLIEKFDDNNRMIEGYDLQKNTYSDQKFDQDTIEKLPVEKEESLP